MRAGHADSYALACVCARAGPSECIAFGACLLMETGESASLVLPRPKWTDGVGMYTWRASCAQQA